MTTADTDKVARLAYQLWENEGRPDGRDWDHWDRARREATEPAPEAPAEETAPSVEPDAAPADTVAAAPEPETEPVAAAPEPVAPVKKPGTRRRKTTPTQA